MFNTSSGDKIDRATAFEPNESRLSELSEHEDVDGVGASKFRYMNAADVAEALNKGRGDTTKVPKVKSVHSDEEQEEAVPDQLGAKNLASTDNPSSSTPFSGMAVPDPEMEQDSTLDMTPPSQEALADSASAAGQSHSESISDERNSEDAQCTSSGSPRSGVVPQPEEVTVGNSPKGRSDGTTAPDADAAVKVTPPRYVKRRSHAQVIPESAPEAAQIADVVPVVEVHIDSDLKPTVFSDYQLATLSSDSGSAVQKLKQFLEDDEESKSRTSRSLHSIPTAIQPGKAFDSLKYFLSSLE